MPHGVRLLFSLPKGDSIFETRETVQRVSDLRCAIGQGTFDGDMVAFAGTIACRSLRLSLNRRAGRCRYPPQQDTHAAIRSSCWKNSVDLF